MGRLLFGGSIVAVGVWHYQRTGRFWCLSWSRLRGDNFSWSSGVCGDPGGLFEFGSALFRCRWIHSRPQRL